jgi:hypothetical protein
LVVCCEIPPGSIQSMVASIEYFGWLCVVKFPLEVSSQ